MHPISATRRTCVANHPSGGRDAAHPEANQSSWRPEDQLSQRDRDDDDRDYRGWQDRGYRDEDRRERELRGRAMRGYRDERELRERATERYGQGQSDYAAG